MSQAISLQKCIQIADILSLFLLQKCLQPKFKKKSLKKRGNFPPIACTIVKHFNDTYQANKNACADPWQTQNRQLVYRAVLRI
jgi:hypothetical protein